MNKASQTELADASERGQPGPRVSGFDSSSRGQGSPRSCRMLPLALATVAAVLLLLSLKLPLWQMRLEAPQYRDKEALKIAVYPNSYRGDLGELTVLNQYIGVHVPPTLSQFKWLPATLVAGAALGFLASLLGGSARRFALTAVVCAIAGALIVAAVQAKSQMHDIGHKRDQKTKLAGVKDFTPPFLGTTKIAQFTVTSRFGLGAWLIGSALALQLGAARLSRRAHAARVQCSAARRNSRSTNSPFPSDSESQSHEGFGEPPKPAREPRALPIIS